MGALGIPGGVFRRAAAVADEFGADAVELLTGRAALTDRTPRGRVSAGGATRLLKAADGWCALTLSRADDIAAVPALLRADTVDEPWLAVERWAGGHDAAYVTDRARLLGLPAARLGDTGPAAPRIHPLAPPTRSRPLTGLLVADLTSMWAGPLCGHLLARAGATVVKVESPTRPDGTRADPAFFDWMNTGKLSYAVDFDRDRPQLTDLLKAADIVLEGSRPAALTRRGLGPRDITVRPGKVWLRITGHGTDGPAADWVAFGDDAAVAGGLVGTDSGGPVFVGDAIADPLTGLHAGAAVSASVRRGGGELIEFALAAVAASYADCAGTADSPESVRPRTGQAAPKLGADTAQVQALVARKNSGSC